VLNSTPSAFAALLEPAWKIAWRSDQSRGQHHRPGILLQGGP